MRYSKIAVYKIHYLGGNIERSSFAVKKYSQGIEAGFPIHCVTVGSFQAAEQWIRDNDPKAYENNQIV